MVDNEYSSGMYKILKISIEALIKYPEILKFVPDHLKVNQSVYIANRTYRFCRQYGILLV